MRKKIIIGILFIFTMSILIQNVYCSASYFVITSPNEGDILYHDSTYTITWKKYEAGHSDYCKLLLYQNEQQVGSVRVFTENDRSYEWILSEDFYKFIGDNYKIRIIDWDDQSIFGFSGSFSIRESIDKPFDFPSIELSSIIIIIILVTILGFAYDSRPNGRHWLITKINIFRDKYRKSKDKNTKESKGKTIKNLKHNPKLGENDNN